MLCVFLVLLTFNTVCYVCRLLTDIKKMTRFNCKVELTQPLQHITDPQVKNKTKHLVMHSRLPPETWL